MQYRLMTWNKAYEEELVWSEDRYYGDWNEVLVRVDDDGNEEIVFADGIEPEDAFLKRDLGVFVDELVALAEKYNSLKQKLEEIGALLPQ